MATQHKFCRTFTISGFLYNRKWEDKDPEFVAAARKSEDYQLTDFHIEKMARTAVGKAAQYEHNNRNTGLITQSEVLAPGLWAVTAVFVDESKTPQTTDSFNKLVADRGPRQMSLRHRIQNKQVVEATVCQEALRPGCFAWPGDITDIPDDLRREIAQSYKLDIRGGGRDAFGATANGSNTIKRRNMADVVKASAEKEAVPEQSNMQDDPKESQPSFSPDPENPLPEDVQNALFHLQQPNATLTSDMKESYVRLAQEWLEMSSKAKAVDAQEAERIKLQQEEVVGILAEKLKDFPGLQAALKNTVGSARPEDLQTIVAASKAAANARLKEAEEKVRSSQKQADKLSARISELLGQRNKAVPLGGIVAASKPHRETANLKKMSRQSAVPQVLADLLSKRKRC